MTELETKSMDECTFSRGQNSKLMNVKFFRGSRRLIRPEELRSELAAIAGRKRRGEVSASCEAPRSTKEKVDVRFLVADM